MEEGEADGAVAALGNSKTAEKAPETGGCDATNSTDEAIYLHFVHPCNVSL